MKATTRTWMAIAAGGVLLAGCATPYDYGYGNGYGPYDDAYYGPGYYNYGPEYYGGASVGPGFAYSDRDHHGERWRERRDWRDRHADGVRDNTWAAEQPRREQWERYDNPQERINRERNQNGGGG